MDIFIDELGKMGLSLLLGSILGIEREYRCRPAGFRTITLICIGATVFTILSQRLGAANIGEDRIAANIVTGVGFIGAGVIFKHGTNVYGLTSAATIWIAAGLGMAVGASEYGLAVVVLIFALIVLSVFEYIQEQLDIFHKKRIYSIRYDGIDLDNIIEDKLSEARLIFTKVKEKRDHSESTCEYEVYGLQKNLDEFNEFLLNENKVTSFEY